MRLLATGSAVALAAMMALPSYAQDSTLQPVVKAATKINESAQQSQQKIDAIADNMQDRLQQYKRILKQIDGL